MINKKRIIAILIVVILLVVGSVVYLLVNSNSVKLPTPGSLFDLNTFDKTVLKKYVSEYMQRSIKINGVSAFATTTPDFKEMYVVYGSKIIGKGMGYTDIYGLRDVGGKLTFNTAIDGLSSDVYYDGQILSEKEGYHYISGAAYFINGKLTYTAIKGGKKFIVYGSDLIGNVSRAEEIRPFGVNGKLLYVVATMNKPLTINSGAGIIVGENDGYYSIGDLFEIDNKLGFIGGVNVKDEEDLFLVYGDKKYIIPNIFHVTYKDGLLSIYTEKDGVVEMYTKKI